MEPRGDYPHQLDTESSTTRESTPNPPPQKRAVSFINRFNEYKLETEFHNGYVVHQTSKWKRLCSSRSWATSTWKKKKRIGSGGFGDVWLQEKEGEGGQLRAVKELPRDSLPDAGRSQEILALVKLNEYHHLFVKFLGWYEDIHSTFLVMEYIELGDLGNYIKGSWAKTEAKEITRQILEGMEVLHKKEICHRDLKPQNILVACLDPVWVKITDFGGSKRVKNTAAHTRVGTSGYTAPEMLGGVPREFITQGFIPHALDIWSLGSLVYELVASETPFLEPLYDVNVDPESGLSLELPGRGTDFASLFRYCHGDIEFPTDVLQKSQLGKEGVAFVKSLLIANPKDRPTATCALQSPWLTDYTSDYVKQLKTEFACLGVDLDLGGNRMRQVGRGDIMRFLPNSVQVLPLAIRAVAQGCGLAISRLLGRSPNYVLRAIDGIARGKLFQVAAETGRLDMIKILLQYGADVGARIGDQTLLPWAVMLGNVKIVDLLLENTDRDSSELLLLAIELGNVGMVSLFLGKGIDINIPNDDGQTVLQTAAGIGHIGIVKMLLDNKADVNAIPAKMYGLTALQAASGRGHIDIVKLLLDNKADVNAGASQFNGRTALQAAAGGGNIEIVKLLVDNKANVNAETAEEYGRTALQAAARYGYIDIAKLLLDNKADVNAEAAEDCGRTALQAAAEGGHTEIVKLLLDSKADVNAGASQFNGRTALQAAAESGNIEIVKLMLDSKADANARTSQFSGRTALGAAAERGHIDIVKLLLDNKADVNAEAAEEYGRTALQAAAEGGHTEIVKLLLDSKADVNAKPRLGGLTALRAAEKNGNKDIIEIFRDLNALS